MAAGKVRQSHLSSLWLEKRTFAALWGVPPHPEGPFRSRGTVTLPPEGAVKVRGWLCLIIPSVWRGSKPLPITAGTLPRPSKSYLDTRMSRQ